MNPRAFLELADEEAAGFREVDWRSAATGAYFAAFHVARNLLRQCGFGVPQAEGAHSYLWLRLANSGHLDLLEAGRKLRDLRRYRNLAHYEIDSFFSNDLALVCVRSADEIIQILEAAIGMPLVRTQITDAMRVYERDVLRQVTWQP